MSLSEQDHIFFKKIEDFLPYQRADQMIELARSGDTRRLKMLLDSGLDLDDGPFRALQTALSADIPKVYVFLAEYGVRHEKRDNIYYSAKGARRFARLMMAFQQVKDETLDDPGKFAFLKGYSAGILLSGVMSPAYSDIKVPMVVWALCLGPVYEVFDKLDDTLKPDDLLKYNMTYRAALTQLNLMGEYNHFVMMKSIENHPVKRRVPLKRSP